MKTLEDIKREAHESLLQYRHYADSVDFSRSVVEKTIDHLHTKGLLMVWRDMDSAPRDGTEILVYGIFTGEVSGRQKENSFGVASWYFGNGWLASNTDHYAGSYDAIAWMPLPAAPKPFSKKEGE